jgi:hypothetical protein
VELYKLREKNNEWVYCYKNNIIYSYSDLFLCDKKNLSILFFFLLILTIYLFYFILLIQILITFFLIVVPLKVSKGGMLFNTLIYIPFLNSMVIKNFYKMFKKHLYKNKTFYKLLFINFLHIYIWGFPRLVFKYAFISIGILKSYENNPDFRGLETWVEIITVVYQETYGILIEKIENKL